MDVIYLTVPVREKGVTCIVTFADETPNAHNSWCFSIKLVNFDEVMRRYVITYLKRILEISLLRYLM